MIHLIQYLCPERHCIVAVPYNDELNSYEAMVARVKEAFPKTGFNAWCGICGSKDLHFEDKVTPWRTIEEAAPFLARGELEQIESRAAMDALGLTFDAKKRAKP